MRERGREKRKRSKPLQFSSGVNTGGGSEGGRVCVCVCVWVCVGVCGCVWEVHSICEYLPILNVQDLQLKKREGMSLIIKENFISETPKEIKI